MVCAINSSRLTSGRTEGCTSLGGGETRLTSANRKLLWFVGTIFNTTFCSLTAQTLEEQLLPVSITNHVTMNHYRINTDIASRGHIPHIPEPDLEGNCVIDAAVDDEDDDASSSSSSSAAMGIALKHTELLSL